MRRQVPDVVSTEIQTFASNSTRTPRQSQNLLFGQCALARHSVEVREDFVVVRLEKPVDELVTFFIGKAFDFLDNLSGGHDDRLADRRGGRKARG